MDELQSEEDSAQLLGTYSNQRSASSAAPAGEMDSTEVIYLPTAQGMVPVAAQINGRLYAIHADHLSTPRRLTNAQGQVAWQWLLTGFGEVSPTTGAKGYVQSDSPVAGSLPSYAPEVTFNLRYPGQQWDEETQLSYNVNRYYGPQEGRYIQADPIGLDGGWNRFAYVNGNPLSYADPFGLQAYMCGPAGLSAWCEKPKQPPQQPPTVGVFGCVGLACLSSNVGDTSPSMSLELTLGGGVEICSPAPPPKPPELTCSQNNPSTWQPPGIYVPARYGGAFIGPSIKRNGQLCVKIGPHMSVLALPSLDLGSNW